MFAGRASRNHPVLRGLGRRSFACLRDRRRTVRGTEPWSRPRRLWRFAIGATERSGWPKKRIVSSTNTISVIRGGTSSKSRIPCFPRNTFATPLPGRPVVPARRRIAVAPGVYPEFVEALQNLDHPEHETTGVDRRVRSGSIRSRRGERGTRRLRRDGSAGQPAQGQTARFAEGDRVRVNAGWFTGNIPTFPWADGSAPSRRIAWLIPLSYENPVDAGDAGRRTSGLCQTPPARPREARRLLAGRGEIELDSAEQPAEWNKTRGTGTPTAVGGRRRGPHSHGVRAHQR